MLKHIKRYLMILGITLFSSPQSYSQTIHSVGTGCGDNMCVWVKGQNFATNSRIDVRYSTTGSIVASYQGADITRYDDGTYQTVTFRVKDSVQQSYLNKGQFLVWIVNPSVPSWNGPGVVQRNARLQVSGGSNYNWHHVDFNGNECNREPYGIITHYHQSGVRATIQSQLSTMYTGGQRRLRIGIFFGTNSYGTVIGAPTGVLPAQFITNLKNYLLDIKAAGYEEVIVAMHPQQEYDFWTASTYSASIADRYWNVVQQTKSAINDTGINHLLDLGNELMPPAGASTTWHTYVTDLWNRHVSAYGTEYTVGFSTPEPERLSNMSIYGPNKPRVVDFHVYTNPSGAYAVANNLLNSQSLNTDIIIGELWYNDPLYAQALRNSINASAGDRWVRWVAQWPRSQTGSQQPSCQGQNVQSPLQFNELLSRSF